MNSFEMKKKSHGMKSKNCTKLSLGLHGRNERGGRGERVPPTIFCEGDHPPHFGSSDVGGIIIIKSNIFKH